MKKPEARILVVDDSPGVVNSLCKVLDVNGYRVDSAFNGSDALRKVQRTNYDIVVCDIEMPGLSGLDFLERVRRDFERDLDVILMTGYLEHEYFIQAIRLGASDFIHKPVDTHQIITAIRSVLDRKRSRDNLSSILPLLDLAEFSLVINPTRFSQFGITKVFNLFLKQSLDLQQNVLNELLICVDEMIYNAYIHGTLELNLQQRQYEHSRLQELIADKLLDEKIAARRIRFLVSLKHHQDEVQIRVMDDGNGFDHKRWMKRVVEESKVNTDGHGRGLSMLYRLCDRVDFFDGGRTVQITRKLNLTPNPE
jgi:DNA-binding response OmpR family regulator